MAKGFNGGIIGARNLTTGGTSGAATGIYSLNEALTFKLAGLWPQEIAVGFTLSTQIFPESTSWIVPTGVTQVDYLLVAGGAGGGVEGSGGGGGGGLRTGSSFPVTPGATYTVAIGAGGIAQFNNAYTSPYAGGNGSNSGIFTTGSSLWSSGGGGGGGTAGGRSGGNGGGGGFSNNAAGLGNLGAYTPSEGNNVYLKSLLSNLELLTKPVQYLDLFGCSLTLSTNAPAVLFEEYDVSPDSIT
jgi:hypothetical protein